MFIWNSVNFNLGKACLSLSTFFLEIGACENDYGFKGDSFILTFAKCSHNFAWELGFWCIQSLQ